MKTKSNAKIEEHANHLNNAWETGEGVQPITALDPELSIDEAYHIQLHTIEENVKQGQTITGKKIGLTSKAMQEMLGVDEPDYGHLLEQMEIENGGTISFKDVLQPKVEGELAFILKDDLIGLNVINWDVFRTTYVIFLALEFIESCIKDCKITIAVLVGDT